jgi:pimeloyl-ACP methyl ester carboxylesterase
MAEIRFLERQGRRLAYQHRPGRAPTIVFLPGYMSDMAGSKASAVDGWAEAAGQAMLRFDYSGCGASDGDFAEHSLADWRDDVLAMIDEIAQGSVVLVGSSMGGWLMLLAALARPERVAALVGIAAAPDFTSWGFTDAQKAEIVSRGRIEEVSPYGDAPSLTTRVFWESGEGLKLLGPEESAEELAIDCPVRLLHGTADGEVPWRLSLRVLEALRSADVQAVLVKAGDHRLSRPQDIALLLATLDNLLESL